MIRVEKAKINAQNWHLIHTHETKSFNLKVLPESRLIFLKKNETSGFH